MNRKWLLPETLDCDKIKTSLKLATHFFINHKFDHSGKIKGGLVKVTDSDIIQSGEKELIDAITGDLDWEAIEKIFKNKYHLGFQEDIEYKNGDIVVHNNQIAYKLNFDVRISLSVLFDRKGECLTVSALTDELEQNQNQISGAGDRLNRQNDPAENTQVESEVEVNENVSQMASKIADMISEINQE
jgi:hypothetical protein